MVDASLLHEVTNHCIMYDTKLRGSVRCYYDVASNSQTVYSASSLKSPCLWFLGNDNVFIYNRYP